MDLICVFLLVFVDQTLSRPPPELSAAHHPQLGPISGEQLPPGMTMPQIDQKMANSAAFKPPPKFEPLHPSTESIWEFEDINYDDETLVGSRARAESRDCWGLHLECLLAMDSAKPICISNFKGNTRTVYSKCEMNYRNCLIGMDKNRDILGIDYRHGDYEYINDGPCS